MPSRYDLIEAPTTCMICIKKEDGLWYDQRPLQCPITHSKKVIERLRRMGRTIKVIWVGA